MIVSQTTDAMFTALMVPDCHEQELTVHLYDGGFQLDNITIDVSNPLLVWTTYIRRNVVKLEVNFLSLSEFGIYLWLLPS